MNKRGLVNHSFEGDNKNRLPSFLRFSVGCARAVQWAAEAVAMGLRRQKILEKTKRTKIYLDVFHYGRLALSLLLLPLVMECYLSRRAPKAKQSWDGDCNDLSGCIADKPYTRALEVSAEPWMIIRSFWCGEISSSRGRCSNFNRGEDFMKQEMVVQTSIEEGILFLEM